MSAEKTTSHISPLESLDIVLRFFAKDYTSQQDIFSMSSIYTNGQLVARNMVNHVELVTTKLAKDGYLEKVYPDLKRSAYTTDEIIDEWSKETTYKMTFSGLVFIEQGGYVGEKRLKDSQTSFQEISQVLLIIGAFIAAIFTGATFYIDYLEKLTAHPDWLPSRWILGGLIGVFAFAAYLLKLFLLRRKLDRSPYRREGQD